MWTILKNRFDLNQIDIIHDILIIRIVKIFCLIISLYVIILIWKWNLIPPQIPIFYSLPRGMETLGTNIHILIFPVYSLIFFGINFIMAAMLYNKEKLAAIFLIISGILATFLLFISFIKIIFLVT